jgi:uncharacterized protein with WD repeat
VTYSPHADDHPSDMKRLIIWDIRTGLEKRNFSSDGLAVWPIFRWSQDDRFFARIGSDVLSVYETPVHVLRFFVCISWDFLVCICLIHGQLILVSGCVG